MDNENTNHPDEKKSLKDDFDESAIPDELLDDSKVKFLNGGKQALDDPHVVVEVFLSYIMLDHLLLVCLELKHVYSIILE